jgi:hypothetical protein
MVVAFDIDDTITEHPEFFSLLSRSLRAGGHPVVIITFREDRNAVAEDLERWGIVYDELVTGSLQSSPKYGTERWKGAMCREHGVDIMFEDDREAISRMDASVLCFVPARGGRPRKP